MATAPGLEAELLRALSVSDLPLMVNLSATTFFDSQGLHALVAALRFARYGGSDIVLQAPHPSVRKVLEISGATEILEVLD